MDNFIKDFIPGLIYLKDYFPSSCTTIYPCCLSSKIMLTIEELVNVNRTRLPCQRCMILELDSSNKFSNHSNMNRRVIHFGYRYDYISKSINSDQCFDINSSATLQNLQILFSKNLQVNQAIINEYLKKQHIGPHIDSDVFGPVIITISLISSTKYKLDKGANTPIIKLDINPGDVIILTGDARNIWRHGTSANSNKSYRRVSITLRQV